MDEHDPENHATIPRAQVPRFDSPIPDYLLDGAPKEIKHLLLAVTTQSQMIEWLVQTALETNQQLRRLEGTTVMELRKLAEDAEDLHRFKERVTGIWPVLTAVGVVISTLAGWGMWLFDKVKAP